MILKLKNKILSSNLINTERGVGKTLYIIYNKINKVGKYKYSLGTLPDFMIIGMQKCGTTSLYNALIQHPDIYAPVKKDTHYFDFYYSSKTLSWYRGFFPSKIFKFFIIKLLQKPFLTCEVSSSYMYYHKTLPKRIKKDLPNIKLIAILRDPVDRAYSNYHHLKKRGKESLSFEEAITKEQERIEQGDITEQKTFDLAYIDKGFYYTQLQSWFSIFGERNILVIQSESFYNEPEKTMREIYTFLNISTPSNTYFPQLAKGGYKQTMNKKTEKELISKFNDENKKLYKLIKKTFNWKKK